VYNAFISYSHSSDGELAPKLEAALQGFAKPWYRLRALNVFRDAANLNLSPGLWDSIVESLGQSDFLLFLASPEAANSKWVSRELEYWLANKDRRKLLILVTRGRLAWDDAAGDFDWTVTDCVPRVLSGVFSGVPLYLDFRWISDGQELSLQHPRFRECVVLLSATLRGQSVEDMVGEEIAQHRKTTRIRNAAIATLSVLLIAAIAAAGVAFSQRAEALRQQAVAEAQRRRAEAANLFNRARSELASGSLLAAIRTAKTSADGYAGDPLARQTQYEVLSDPTAILTTIREPIDSHPAVAFSARGDRILSLSANAAAGYAARLWDWAGSEVASFDFVYFASFAPNPGTLIVGFPSAPIVRAMDDGSLCGNERSSAGASRVVDSVTVDVEHAGARAALPIGFQELTESGDRLAVCGNFVTVENAAGVVQLTLRTPGAVSASFTPDRRRVVVATADRTIVHDLVDGTETTLAGRTPTVSPDGQFIATVSGSTTSIWDRVGRAVARKPGTAPVWAAADRILTITNDSTRLWPLAPDSRDPLAEVAGVEPRVSPDGQWLVTMLADDRSRVSDLAGHELTTLEGGSAQFSPLGPVVMTATASGIVRLWDLRRVPVASAASAARLWGVDEASLTPLPADQTRAGCVFQCVSPDGATRASAMMSGVTPGAAMNATVVVEAAVPSNGEAGKPSATSEWKPASSAPPSECPAPVRALEFSPAAGHDLLFGCGDGSVRVLDRSGALRWQGKHDGEVTQAAFSADGQHVLTASTDRTARLWNAGTGAEVTTLAGHESDVTMAALSNDARRIVSLTSRGTVRLWELGQTGADLLATMTLDDDAVVAVTFSADGTMLLARTRTGAFRRWLTDPSRLPGEYDWLDKLSIAPAAVSKP
jgi:WD40 repeat protein